jgi:hypothetical protein
MIGRRPPDLNLVRRNTFQTTFHPAGSCRSKTLQILVFLTVGHGKLLHHCACADSCPDFSEQVLVFYVSFTYEEGTVHFRLPVDTICCRSRMKCRNGDMKLFHFCAIYCNSCNYGCCNVTLGNYFVYVVCPSFVSERR